jgi:uncharacterized membrane protein
MLPVLFGGTMSVPAGLIWTGIALFTVVAALALLYFGYHRWHGRGRFTADSLYHRQRAHLGFVALSVSGLFVFLLLLLGANQ